MSAEKIALPNRDYTVDDFFALVQDGEKADLIDGVIYMASPDTPRNDDLGGFLLSLMRPYARRGSFGRVTGSRVAYVLANRRAPEPDVAFVRQERLDRIQQTRVLGPPDIAVEIVSADSRDRDYHIKCRLYEEAGVSEYWIIDPESQRHQFLRLQNGTFELVPLHQGHFFISEALPGFWLDVAWLRADPLPDELECLQQILAGPPF